MKLVWTPDDRVVPEDRSVEPRFSPRVQEQMGLRLESRKGPMEIMVNDRAKRFRLKLSQRIY